MNSIVRRRTFSGLLLVVCIHAQLASAAPLSGMEIPAYRDVRWQHLVPPDWDPMKRFRNADIGGLSDTSSKAAEIMREMRDILDNAPTNPNMDGAGIRLSGYVVPLDEANGQMSEFLLVPYFGACIHTPPPPSNQIVHIVAETPTKGLRSMDAVTVTGILKISRAASTIATSSYEMRPAGIVPFVRP